MKQYSRELKWLLGLFLATLVWMYFEKMMGWHGPNIQDHAYYSIIYDGFFLLIFMLAFWERRQDQSLAHFTWKRAFFYGMRITLGISLLSPLTQTIIHKIISPEFFPNIIDYAVEHKILTLSEAEQNFNIYSYIVQNFIGTAILGTLCSLILASLFYRRANGLEKVNDSKHAT